MKQLLTKKQACEKYKMGHTTLNNIINNPKIPVHGYLLPHANWRIKKTPAICEEELRKWKRI